MTTAPLQTAHICPLKGEAAHLIWEIRAGCRSGIGLGVKKSLFSVWGWVTAVYGVKKKKTTLWWCLWGVSTSRWQHAVGCHLLRSYLCPAQVGGCCRSLSLCFLLWGIFSWPRFDMAQPQPNNHSSDGGGCASLYPQHPGIWEKLSQGKGRVGGSGGRGRWVEVWTPGEYRFIDRWFMWNGIKREDFGPSGGFRSGVRLSGSASQHVCVSVVFFYLFFKTLSLCDLFLNPLLFIRVIFPFILAPVFLSERGDGVGAQGLSTGIKSALLNFSWRLTLICFSPHPTNTVSNYPHHRLRYYYHQRYRPSSSIIGPILAIRYVFLSKRSEKSEHSHFRSVTGSIWLSRLSE